MSGDVKSSTKEDAGARAGAQTRRRTILNRLEEQEFVSIKELAEEFEITEMSLRRDLTALADRGLVARVRGGAKRARNATPSRMYLESERRNAQTKARIARAAAVLLDGASTVFFYSGSTVAKVASALSEAQRASLTVVTPSLPVVNEVTSWSDPHLVAVGGLYLPSYMAFVGPQAIESLSEITADIAIMGCDGLTAEEGLTTPHQLVAEVGAMLVERARRVIVVADSTKVGRRGFTPIASVSGIDALVTDSDADTQELQRLRESGVEVHHA